MMTGEACVLEAELKLQNFIKLHSTVFTVRTGCDKFYDQIRATLFQGEKLSSSFNLHSVRTFYSFQT